MRRGSVLTFHCHRQPPKTMSGQVGGISRNKMPLLQLVPDFVLKPMQTGNRGIREVAFYEAIRCTLDARSHLNCNNTLGQVAKWLFPQLHYNLKYFRLIKDWERVAAPEGSLLTRLAEFVPAYYGVLEHQSSPEQETPIQYLVLRDMTDSYLKPCVMDIKMGTQTYEPEAPEEKKMRESSKYPQQTTFGFRIVGLKRYDPGHQDANSLGVRTLGKSFGRSLTTPVSILDTLRYFLSSNQHPEVRHDTLSQLVQRLESLFQWFVDNDSFSFYASSILIVYEGENQNQKAHVDMKMIDFGHVRRSLGGDDGYKAGLSMLILLCEELLLETRT